MKRVLVAGLLALFGLSLGQVTASADCFHVYKPCIRLPVPAIPIYCPSFKFFCESCNGKNCPCPSGPWYSQFPGGAPAGGYGYMAPAYGGFGGSVYGGWGGSAYSAQGWGGGYGQNYAVQPAPQWNGGYAQSPQGWTGGPVPQYTAYPNAWNNQ